MLDTVFQPIQLDLLSCKALKVRKIARQAVATEETNALQAEVEMKTGDMHRQRLLKCQAYQISKDVLSQ